MPEEPSTLPFFLFGSLMDPDIAQVVLGRRLAPRELRAAVLPGYRRLVVAEETYPALAPCVGARVNGVLLRTVSETEVARMRFFESAEFAVQSCRVVLPLGGDAQARVFLASAVLEYSDREWDYARRLRREKQDYLHATREWMQAFGRREAAELEAQWELARRGQAPATDEQLETSTGEEELS